MNNYNSRFNSRFDAHDRAMNRQTTIFWIMFTVVALGIATMWCLVGVCTYKTIKCVGDQQCLEQQGQKLGSFVKGLQEGAGK